MLMSNNTTSISTSSKRIEKTCTNTESTHIYILGTKTYKEACGSKHPTESSDVLAQLPVGDVYSNRRPAFRRTPSTRLSGCITSRLGRCHH